MEKQLPSVCSFHLTKASGSGGSRTPGDSYEWRAAGRNFPGDKAEAAHRGLGVERMKQTKNASKKERAKRKENIYGMPRVYFLFLFYFSCKCLSYKEAFSIPTLEGFL